MSFKNIKKSWFEILKYRKYQGLDLDFQMKYLIYNLSSFKSNLTSE